MSAAAPASRLALTLVLAAPSSPAAPSTATAWTASRRQPSRARTSSPPRSAVENYPGSPDSARAHVLTPSCGAILRVQGATLSGSVGSLRAVPPPLGSSMRDGVPAFPRGGSREPAEVRVLSAAADRGTARPVSRVAATILAGRRARAGQDFASVSTRSTSRRAAQLRRPRLRRRLAHPAARRAFRCRSPGRGPLQVPRREGSVPGAEPPRSAPPLETVRAHSPRGSSSAATGCHDARHRPAGPCTT